MPARRASTSGASAGRARRAGCCRTLVETLVIYIRDEIARPNLGAKTDRYLPYLLTVFFFILTCNLLGLLPFGATATATSRSRPCWPCSRS